MTHADQCTLRGAQDGGLPAAVPPAAALLAAAALAAAVLAIFLGAPTEATMGHAQRIVYVHVAVAWLGLLGSCAMGASGAAYLLSRKLAWDHWFQSAAEVGWLCGGLTLLTGSLWARQAWGTWWEWDPRLTASFILWAIYSGILIVRSGLEDAHQRAHQRDPGRAGHVGRPAGRDGHAVVPGHAPGFARDDAGHARHAVGIGHWLHGGLCPAGRMPQVPAAAGKRRRPAAAPERRMKGVVSMVAFGAAYMIVWLAVVLYVARLTVHQRRLRDKVERLRASSDMPASGCETTSRAA